ncbi:MAG: hypothetical protein Q8O84_05340 [Nanoarchaeota archaeon]|nr:hypothetical protein [Nanoarchaeota archaeon]
MTSGKGLIRKLKTGIAGLALIGAPYFNSVNAQTPEKENYQPKYDTFAHKMVMIEDSGIAGSHLSLKKLDEVIDLSKKFIKKTHYTKQELSDLSKKIYSTINSVDYSLAHDNDEAPLFPGDLPTCYIYSIYYLGVGQANNLPFYAVSFEKKIIEGPAELIVGGSLGHMFIRYDPNGKHNPANPNDPVNKGDENIEASIGEIQDKEHYSDNYYLKGHDLPKGSLINLDEKKLLGIAYGWRGAKTIVYANKIKNKLKDELDKEIEDCKRYRDPYYGYSSLATESQKEECLKKKNIEFRKDSMKKEHTKLINESLKYLDEEIKLNPNSFGAYYCKGRAYESLDTKDFELKSIENFIKATEIAPSPWIYRDIAFAYSSLDKDGCYKDIEYITKAINLAKENVKKAENLKKYRIDIKYAEYLSNAKYFENILEILERNKEVIEESAKYHYHWCDKIKNSKQSP